MKRPWISALLASSELLVTIGTYLLLGGALIFGLLLVKIAGTSYQNLWSDRLRVPSAAALVAGLAAVWLFTAGFRKAAIDRRRKFWFPITANALAVLIGLLLTEASLRAIARPDPVGVRISAMPLVPYDWKELARVNLTFLEQHRSRRSFFIEDSLLGWTIGPGREGNDGMYKSSAEGLRSMDRGANFRSREARNRVVLFGDSFTFGNDVPFEQSWGHYLENNLGASTQVLNFGVDGYGVDQAYLRFKREAAQWAPSVSILAFIQDDLYRNVTVYPFFRLSWERPFSKPRFVMNGEKLELLNVPNIPPDSIFRKGSTEELPLLDYDGNFDGYYWEQHAFYASYLGRFMATEFPRWEPRNAYTNETVAVQLGRRLIKEFVNTAHSLKSAALIVYLPSRNDFDGNGPVLEQQLRNALAGEGIEVQDMTPCLTTEVARTRLFAEGKPHYSGEGNAAVARCLQPLVAAYLN
jgi:GDSL-like lipase/acylhydrolase family protein